MTIPRRAVRLHFVLMVSLLVLVSCEGVRIPPTPTFVDREFLNQAVGHAELGMALMDRGIAEATRQDVRDLAVAVRDEEKAGRERLLELKQRLFAQQATPVPLKGWVRVPENEGRSFDEAWLREALRHAEATETVAAQADIPAALPEIRESAQALATEAKARRATIAKLIDAEP